jgi:putative transposase
LDFVLDVLENGRRVRLLAVVDDFTRACLAIEVDTSIGGHRVVQVLERVVAERGRPAILVMESGPEFVGRARSTVGRMPRAFSCISSSPASRTRIPTSRASTGGSATSASTNTDSSAWPRRFGRHDWTRVGEQVGSNGHLLTMNA